MNGEAAVLTDLLAAYNAHDAAAAVALYAPDGEHREVAQSASRRGHEALRAGLDGFLRAFPDAHWALERSAASDHTAMAAYTLTGTLRERLGPLEPAGQQLRIEGVLVLALEDGRIAWSADYWDAGTFMRQMRA